jgi:hypothetical protein
VTARRLLRRPPRWRLLLVALLTPFGFGLWGWWTMVRMPGTSFVGELQALTTEQRALADDLRAHVTTLAVAIGERNVLKPEKLAAAADHVTATFAAAGYATVHQVFSIGNVRCENLAVERPGSTKASEIVVVGAHYDSVTGCPGANDNGSGAAALLALARRFADRTAARTLRFVAFTNEEPPLFKTADMGSLVYARACRDRGDKIVAMVCLETMGCFRSEPGSQHYPFPFGLCYPSRGDFIAFVGDRSSSDLVRRCVGVFRALATFPCEGGAMPGWMPGVGWSDHWSFWQIGCPAVMVTDTAPFRFRDYHQPTDTVDKVDCDRLARVVEGVERVIADLTTN